jgi:ketosteroid isomerase-like protein
VTPGAAPAPAPDPRDVARRYVESFAAGDPDRIAAFVADGFVNEHTAALGQGTTGRAAYRAALPGFLARFPGLRYDIEDVVAEGVRVAVFYRMRSGPTDLRGAFRLTIVDGLVTHRVDYWDALTYLRQTGQA